MERKPILSVGMPAYNAEKHIREAIESILNQSFSNFVLNISDNASTDNTEAICREYEKLDSRVKYYRCKKNIGANRNFNKVFEYCASPFFKWVSSNDLHTTTSFQNCLGMIKHNKDAVLCYPKTKLFYDCVEKAEKYEDKVYLLEDSPCQRYTKFIEFVGYNHALYGVVRTDVLKKIGKMKVFEGADICYVAEIALHGKFLEYPEYLYYRRMDSDSCTSLISDKEHAHHLDPETDRILFQSWKQILCFYNGVYGSPISKNEKSKIYKYLFKMLRMQRATLTKEIFKDTFALLSGKQT